MLLSRQGDLSRLLQVASGGHALLLWLINGFTHVLLLLRCASIHMLVVDCDRIQTRSLMSNLIRLIHSLMLRHALASLVWRRARHLNVGWAASNGPLITTFLQLSRIVLEVSRRLRHVVAQLLLALCRLHVLVRVDVQRRDRQIWAAEAARQRRLTVITRASKISLALLLNGNSAGHALCLSSITQARLRLRRAVISRLRLLRWLQVILPRLLSLMPSLLAVRQQGLGSVERYRRRSATQAILTLLHLVWLVDTSLLGSTAVVIWRVNYPLICVLLPRDWVRVAHRRV